MTDYIIRDITAVADAEAYIISGETTFDAINKFDRMIRKDRNECVNHAIVSTPETKWIFTTETVKADKFYKANSYVIYPKEDE